MHLEAELRIQKMISDAVDEEIAKYIKRKDYSFKERDRKQKNRKKQEIKRGSTVSDVNPP